MIRNFIKRENLLIVTSSTKASITSAVPGIPSEKVEEAKQPIAPPPVAEEKSIAQAKKMPVNSLVTVTGKIVRIDDVQARTLRNQETVNVRSVIIKDSTGAVTVSLWRELTETTLEIGQSYRLTDLKLNYYHGVQLNTLSRSTVVKVETPAEEVTVMVDGFFMEKDKSHFGMQNVI